MGVKCTMLFQLATGTEQPNPSLRRIGGWSESFYFPGNDIQVADLYFNGGPGGPPASWCELRAGLLPSSAQIVGQRYQIVDPVGRSQSLNKIWNGGSGLSCDVPQMALLTRLISATTPNTRMYIIRGIPDQMVIDGEYRPSIAYRNAVNRLLVACSQLAMKVKPIESPRCSIATVDNTGLITFNTQRPTSTPFARIELRNVLSSNGTTINGNFATENLPSNPLQLKLLVWDGSNAHGGQAFIVSSNYPQFSSTGFTIGRVIVRKVGRPFVAFRGRASVRRRRRRVA